MTISAKCSQCGKRLSGPDSAAGRKVKCPKCGQVVSLPGAPEGGATGTPEAAKGRKPSTADLAQALTGTSDSDDAKRPSAVADVTPREAPKKAAGAEPSPPPLSAASGPTPPRSSTTTMSRMLARSSPYKTLRLLGVIIFGAGIVVAVLAFLGGLTYLILGSTAGHHPALTVGAFIGALVFAAVTLLVSKASSEMLRLWADVGDRARHLTMMFEETMVQQRGNGLNNGSR
jgi:phage FluMu protein Com